ncbi:MAG: hypothetical protein IT377_12085, partial [Polyangiaceae bacterium]|nr:hypothetical protein [Polyangiaceae bacterium]
WSCILTGADLETEVDDLRRQLEILDRRQVVLDRPLCARQRQSARQRLGVRTTSVALLREIGTWLVANIEGVVAPAGLARVA